MSGLSRPKAVLAMDAADEWAEEAQGWEWTVGAVKDEVARVEIHAQVRPADVRQEADEHGGRFLAGLQQEALSALGAVVRDPANGVAEPAVMRMARIGRNEPDVGRQGRDAEILGQITVAAGDVHPVAAAGRV